ncbi:hypothetical protein DFR52_103736 [Hoeflea marina]|uniref:Uncharacterized protein n=1 Tax=Hoeflea marina TaxID=274592 RepID=A0A317PIW0_9HYPH|nr:hypothetical protein [Hoeflea marina]PWW00529.1 hypothetical protein DFR52_103736 [Hoeflea marina]
MIAAAQTPRRRRGFAALMSVLLVVIILFATAPLLSVLLSSWIAAANDCVLNEGGVHPCVIAGVDHGETLAIMFVAGWFMFFTVPAGAAALAVWLIVLVLGLVMRRQGRNPAQ